MGAETQLMEFIFDAQTRKFEQGVGRISEGFEKVDKNASNLFTKAIGKGFIIANVAMKAFTKVISVTQEKFVDHLKIMEDYRRESGLTTADIGEFSREVTSSAAKYGVALSRVSTMATFINKGMGRAGKSVIELSAGLADLGDVTGATDEDLQNLGFILTRQFNMEAKDAFKTSYVLTDQAKSLKVAFGDVVRTLAGHKEALRILPIKESTKQLGALTAAMLANGAANEQVEELIAQFGDTSSTVYKTFIGSGKDVGATMGVISRQVRRLQDNLDGSAAKQAQYEMAMSSLAEKYGVSKFTLEKLTKSRGDYNKSLEAGTEAEKLSLEQHQANNRKRLSNWGILSKKLEGVYTNIAGVMNDLFGPDSKTWSYVEITIDMLGKAADKIGGWFEKFFTFIGPALDKIAEFYGYARDITEFMLGVERAKMANVKGGGTKGEETAWFAQQFRQKAAVMEAKGIDATQYRADRARDLANIAQREGVSPVALSSMSGDMGANAAQILGQLLVEAQKGRKAQEERVRQENMNKINNSSSAANTRSNSGVEMVTR